ncbi:hypothetical protein HPB49_020939 [Dermacentor silvarum]|uniref:Uncharacterized protein n=1 Tax=Dermacentor silvarum TaxID=543639 RepID=A0ACB8D7N1_DERSI|nr:hypothetical protein HPB49_020939 [Dermacentor silvarum]
MEAFNDLQRHWAKRFPHSKLSLIWEEDLRTLLSTHRQRVAQLREELEQEEFLVQYFERYLSDAERVKRSSSRDNTGDRKAGSANGDSPRNSNGVGTSNGLPEAAAGVTSSTCEKAASLKRDKAANSAEGQSASVNGTTDEHGKPYVTVIAVSGFTRSASSERSGSSAAAASTGSTSSTHAAAETQELRRRRKPPTPPPKRAKWPPPSVVSQLAQNDAAQSDVLPAFSTFRPASQLASAPSHPPAARPHGYPQPLREAPPPPTAPVIEPTDDQDGYDVIYDTVALDDEACSSKGADEEDQGSSPEPDYVEFGKLERPRAVRSASDDAGGGSVPSPVASSATYENMALLVKASESMDSEEDDAASMLRSMSSDAELDQDAGTATTGSDHSGSGGRSADLHRCKTEEQLDVDSGCAKAPKCVGSREVFSSGERNPGGVGRGPVIGVAPCIVVVPPPSRWAVRARSRIRAPTAAAPTKRGVTSDEHHPPFQLAPSSLKGRD